MVRKEVLVENVLKIVTIVIIVVQVTVILKDVSQVQFKKSIQITVLDVQMVVSDVVILISANVWIVVYVDI